MLRPKLRRRESPRPKVLQLELLRWQGKGPGWQKPANMTRRGVNKHPASLFMQFCVFLQARQEDETFVWDEQNGNRPAWASALSNLVLASNPEFVIKDWMGVASG